MKSLVFVDDELVGPIKQWLQNTLGDDVPFIMVSALPDRNGVRFVINDDVDPMASAVLLAEAVDHLASWARCKDAGGTDASDD